MKASLDVNSCLIDLIIQLIKLIIVKIVLNFVQRLARLIGGLEFPMKSFSTFNRDHQFLISNVNILESHRRYDLPWRRRNANFHAANWRKFSHKDFYCLIFIVRGAGVAKDAGGSVHVANFPRFSLI